MTKRSAISVLTVLALFVGVDRAVAQPPPVSKELVVYATGDTDGELATPRCRETPILTESRLSYAHQVGYFRRLAPRLRADSAAFAPVAVHLGDSAYPGPLGRYLLSQGEQGARQLAGILMQMPYASHTLGNRELGLRHADLHALAEGALLENLPLRAANLVCTPEGGAEALCEATGQLGGREPYDVIEREGLRILSVSLIDPSIRDQIAAKRLTGLDILDPKAVLERRLEEMRRETSPDLVFLQYHAAAGSRTEFLVELSRAFPEIDLITTNEQLAPGAGRDESRHNGYIRASGSGTYIVPAGLGPNHAAVVRLQLDRTPGGEDPNRWELRQLDAETVDTRSGPLDPSTAELLWRSSEQLCEAWGKPIHPEAPLANPFDRSDFVAFVLNTMRHAGRAEVALMNDGAIPEAGTFPVRRRLTYADVYTFLPFENPMVVARMRGDALRGVARSLGDTVRAEGLEVVGTTLLVNGRPVRDDRMYSVATNRFVADGGDDILEPGDLKDRDLHVPAWSSETPSISELVIHFVRSGDYIASGQVERRLSPQGIFPDLHRRLLWSMVGSVNASFNQVAVTNPTVDDVPVYNQSQLRVQPTRQMHFEGAFQANADSRNHEWDNSLLVQYALARLDSGSGSEDLQETSDVIRAISRYKFAGIRSWLEDPWWGPMPMGELQLETEVDQPKQRNWRKLELTGILGSTFELSDRLELRAGFDLRRDFNDPGAKTVYGVMGAYQLHRTALIDLLGHPVQFESQLEYFFNDPFFERLHELRTTSRLFFSLYGDLHVTSTFSAFLFRSGFVGTFGRNTELTMGLNYRWDEAIQTF